MSRCNLHSQTISAIVAGSLAMLSGCQNFIPQSVNPPRPHPQTVATELSPDATASLTSSVAGDRVSSIYQGNLNDVTVEDAAIALAIAQVPTADANEIASAANNILRNAGAIAPASLDVDLLSTDCIDFATQRDTIDLRDIAAIVAAEVLGNDLQDASDVVTTANRLLPSSQFLETGDIAFIPGQTLPCTPPMASAFDIQLRFFDASLSSSQQAIIREVANRWMRAIVSDLSDETLNVAVGECFSRDTPSLNQRVDDLFIDVYAAPIDGSNGTLAQAGPCILRPGPLFLPAYGVMQFDSSDLNQLELEGELFAIASHEMAHVLGFGTIWAEDKLNLLERNDEGLGLSDPRFLGENAIQAFASLGGAGTIPVENIGGPGSIDSHWREITFGDELMTSRVMSGASPLSRLSIAQFADLGYRVDLSQAEPYTLPNRERLNDATSLQFQKVLGTDHVLYPKRFVGERQ
ncbi:MAG: leishmanolysin-related zinc metalloendopeptidase [Cyanobacteria bacterium P01_F01_bin.33]